MTSEIMLWLLPSGGMLSLLTWLSSRRRKKTEDMWSMFATLKRELCKVQTENIKLYDAIRELTATLTLASRCPYYDTCPIVDRLPRHKAALRCFDPARDSDPQSPAGDNFQPYIDDINN